MKVSLLLLLIGLFMFSSCSTAPITHGIPNLHQVNDKIWRGGQPTPEGWVWLKSQGVTTDIKLNTESEASDSMAVSNGIAVVRLPITLLQQLLLKPKTTTINDALSAIQFGITNGAVYIHCQHGQDRTGLVTGTFRVKSEHWSKGKAWTEMKAIGFHTSLFGLYRYWNNDVLDNECNNIQIKENK